MKLGFFVHLFNSSDVDMIALEDLHEIISNGVTDKPQLEDHFRSEDFSVVQLTNHLRYPEKKRKLNLIEPSTC